MPPMVIRTAENKVLLAPNNLGPDFKPGRAQRGSDHPTVKARVPAISNITGEQLERRRPVDPVLCQNSALLK